MAAVVILIIGWKFIQRILRADTFYHHFLTRNTAVWQLFRRYTDNLRKKATQSTFSMTPTQQPPPSCPFSSPSWRPAAAMGRKDILVPKPPPNSFDDEEWDGVDWNNTDWDEQSWDCPPFFTPPQTPTPLYCQPETQIELRSDSAPDIVVPGKSTVPCTVVDLVRHKFMQDASGGFTRVPTPGTDLLCGLHAARLCTKYQPSFCGVRQPTSKELLCI